MVPVTTVTPCRPLTVVNIAETLFTVTGVYVVDFISSTEKYMLPLPLSPFMCIKTCAVFNIEHEITSN